MRSIIVYSGKGGVGKTTITSSIAKYILNKGLKVLIIDGDINTPSMNTVFKGENPESNLWVISSGNMFDSFIFMEKAMVRKFFSEAKHKIKEVNPDFILVDTPPSITNVHIELFSQINVSHILFVSQPNDLSRSDVIRTASFFKRQYPLKCGGSVVENMCTSESSYDYGMEVLAHIKFEESFDTSRILQNNLKDFERIFSVINECTEVEQNSELPRLIYDESFDIIRIFHGRKNGYELEIKRDGEDLCKTMFLPELKFLSLRTWDKIRDFSYDEDWSSMSDQRVANCTTDRISRLLSVFSHSDSGYFMITVAPHTGVKLIPGEVGLASLDTECKLLLGIPCIQYQTSKGSIRLFPDEVKPADTQMIQEFLSDGYHLLSDGRYLPPKDTVEELYNAFGSRVGLLDSWESDYDEWLNS